MNETMTPCKSIFISRLREDNLSDRIYMYFAERFKLQEDSCQLLGYRSNLINLEKDIERYTYVIIVLSNQYLKSFNCLYELHCILRREKVELFPIVLDPRLLNNFYYRALGNYLSSLSKSFSGDLDMSRKFALENDGYVSDVLALYNRFIKDRNLPIISCRNFNEVLSSIEESITKSILKGKSIVGNIGHGISHIVINNVDNIINNGPLAVVDKPLSEGEKVLVSHFVLWPKDYLLKNVVYTLLDGVFDTEIEMTEAIVGLEKRNVILSQNGSWKLNEEDEGDYLSLIDVKTCDYSVYLNNIESIINYDNSSFVKFAECIGYSVSNNDFRLSDYFLVNIAKKLQMVSYYDYSDKIYNKVIDMRKCKVEKEPDDPKYQNYLASAYNNLALMQSNNLNDYVSAEENYKKAISIMERLPENNLEYQNGLASAYNNLANMQKNNLNDYASAVENYKKAISIMEHLPKDNPDYQNDLASAYNNLANMQFNNFNDYASADENYKKAISIMECLPKNNPEYQNALASAYNNLANMQKNNLDDYASAEANYKKAILIRERLPENNPEYQNGLASVYYNLANMLFVNINDYASAGENYKKAISIMERLPKSNPDYQNDLAWAYNNLAFLQKDSITDIDSAIVSMKKAVDIWSNWKNLSLQFLIIWLERSWKLAQFFFEAGKRDDSLATVQEIVPTALECKEAYPENERVQNVAACIMEQLEEMKSEND